MASVVRVDPVLDYSDTALGTLHIGSSGGATKHETVDEAIEALTVNDPEDAFFSVSTRDVTSEFRPVMNSRASYTYAPQSEPRFIEVLTRQVYAVYVGASRPVR